MKKLLLVGCGEMGGALLKAWRQRLPSYKIDVVNLEKPPLLDSLITWAASPQDLPQDPYDVLVFAVRPHVLEDILPLYRPFVGPETLSISIAAGKPLAVLKEDLGQGRFLRAMPNLAAAVSKAITFLYGDASQTPEAHDLFSAVGTCVVLPQEDMMNLATALGGCGPGFMYYMCQMLEDAAVSLGFPRDLAAETVPQVLKGAASFLDAHPASFETLVRQVAVPQGMTEAGVKIMEQDNQLLQLFQNVLRAADHRGLEIQQKKDAK